MLEEPEGATPLGPDEMQGLKFKHIRTRGELDELEQANIQDALLWLSARKRGDILKEDFIRILHRRLFGNGRERFVEENSTLASIQFRLRCNCECSSTMLATG